MHSSFSVLRAAFDVRFIRHPPGAPRAALPELPATSSPSRPTIPFAHDVFSSVAVAFQRRNALTFIAAGYSHAVLEAADESEYTDLKPHTPLYLCLSLQKDRSPRTPAATPLLSNPAGPSTPLTAAAVLRLAPPAPSRHATLLEPVGCSGIRPEEGATCSPALRPSDASTSL